MRRTFPVLMLLCTLLATPGRSDSPPSGGGAPAGSVVMAGPAGVYTLTISVPAGVKVHQTATSIVFDWSGQPDPFIPPDPDPPPTPDPTPTPVVSGKLWSVLIFPNPQTPDQATIRNSTTLPSALQALDTTCRTFEAGQADLQANGYEAAMTRHALTPPAYFVVGQDGIIHAKGAITSEADLVATVRKLRGVASGKAP
jgi:hypothetical protein